MIVGSAEVVIRAIGDKLEGDIQKSLNNAAKKAGPAGEKAGDNYVDGLVKSINSNSGQVNTSLNRALERAGTTGSTKAGENVVKNVTKSIDNNSGVAAAGDRMGQRIGNNVARGLGRSNMRRGVASVLFKLGALIPIVGILLGGISTLVSGLFAMSGVLTLAASSSVALAGALGSLGLVVGASMIGFKGVGEAIKNGMDPARAAQFAESMKKIAPAARPFVKEFVKLKDDFKAIRNAAAAGLFPGLERALGRVAPILPRMRNEFKTLGKAGGDAVDTIAKSFTSLNFRQNMSEIVGSAPIVVGNLAKAFGNLGNAIASTLAAAAPLTERFSAALKRSTANLRDQAQAGKESGKLQSFFNRAGDAAAQMGRIIGNVVEGLFDIGKVGGKTGQRLFDVFEKATKGLADYTDKKKNVDGLKKAFDGIGDNMIAIGGLAKDVGKAFLRMGANPGIAKTANAIKAIIPNIERALTAGIGLGPKIAELVGHIADLFTAFEESGALSAVLGIFNAIAKALVAIANAPGAGTVIKIMAIVTALRLLGRAGGALGNVVGRNLVAMDAAVGRTARGMRTLQAPMVAVNNQATRMGRAFQTSHTGLSLLGARAQYAGRHVGDLGKGSGLAGRRIAETTGRTAGLSRNLGGIGKGAGIAGLGLLAVGGAAAAGGVGIDRFSGTITGALIGSALPGIGTAAGAAAGGLVDLTRLVMSLDDNAKNAAKSITASMKALSTQTNTALKSVGMADNAAALTSAQSKLKGLFQKRIDAKFGADTTALDKAIKSAKGNVAQLKASIEKGTNNFDIKINFAQSMSDLNGFMKTFRTTVSQIEQKTGKKFKFDIDSGPFQQASRDIYTSLRTVGDAALNAGGPALDTFRNKIQGMRGTFGLSANAAGIFANKLMGFPDLLAGIPDRKNFVLDADTKAALSKMGFVEADFKKLRDGIEGKPFDLDVRANTEGAKKGLEGVYASVKELPPETVLNIQTDAGPVQTTVGQLGAAVNSLPENTTMYIDESGANVAGINISRTQQILDALGGTTATPQVAGKGFDQFSGLMSGALDGLNTFDSTNALAGIGVQVAPGVPSAIANVMNPVAKIAATDVFALVGAKQGNMSAVAAVLQQTGKISATDAKAIAGSKPGNMRPLADVLLKAKLIDGKTYDALVGTKLDKNGLQPGKDVEDTAKRIDGHPGAKIDVGLQKAKTSGGLFGTIGELMRTLAPPQRPSVVNVQVVALTGNAKLAIAGLSRTAPVNVQVTALMGNAKLAIAGLARTAPVNIKVTALTGPAKVAIAGLSRKAPINIKVTALTGNAKLAIAGLARKAPVIVKVTANIGAATKSIQGIKGKTVSVIVTGRGMGSVQSAINRIQGKTVYVTIVQNTVKRAKGGFVYGSGTATSDSIPAMLSTGEFVVRAAMAKRYAALLQSINSGAGVPRDVSPIMQASGGDYLPGDSRANGGVGAMVMEVTGMLDLGNSKAYITGVAKRQSESDTAYKNSLHRVGQN